MTFPRSFSRLLALILMTSPALAKANIGDDLPTLRQRYGSVQPVGGEALFQHDGYSICVYFDGAHAGMEVFCRDGSKKDKAGNVVTDITQDDIDAILAAEGEGLPWNQVTSHTGKPTWLRADRKLVVRISEGTTPGEKYVTVMLNEKYANEK